MKDWDSDNRRSISRLNRQDPRIIILTIRESAPLIEYLFAHQVRPEFTCRFHWEPGAIAFWDNRCALHNPINDYHGFRRIMHRVTLAGDRPR
jgi:taurine dioxygenase